MNQMSIVDRVGYSEGELSKNNSQMLGMAPKMPPIGEDSSIRTSNNQKHGNLDLGS